MSFRRNALVEDLGDRLRRLREDRQARSGAPTSISWCRYSVVPSLQQWISCKCVFRQPKLGGMFGTYNIEPGDAVRNAMRNSGIGG